MSDDKSLAHEQRLTTARDEWNAAAATFDDEPDHGLRDPRVLAAWTALIKLVLPTTTGTLLDIGCGTGSLSVVLAGLGYTVTGVDLSPAMINLAKTKAAAANHAIEFHVMDASYPQFPPRHFDVIICRHLLWALPQPDQVLQRWVALLKPNGRLLMVEGYWHTGAGMHAQQILDVLPSTLTNITHQSLSAQPDLWGSAVTDERYLISADLRP
jgi:2-polyprenyl-3-methyl-5-hydroxy-6-metoxy-1,4-benzoquinol methylase